MTALSLTLADLEALRSAIETAAREGDSEALAVLVAEAESLAAWRPQPHQTPPDVEWSTWALLGGRGTGKTDAGAAWINSHMMGPPCDMRVAGGHRGRIIAPTFADAVSSCVNGPAGIRAHNHAVTLTGNKEGTLVQWPNGASARIFGAHTPGDVDRLRAGGNACVDWFEELAADRYAQDAWDQAAFGRRLGHDPKAIITTTPRNMELIRWVLASAGTYAAMTVLANLGVFAETYRPERRERLVVTKGSTADNPYLDSEVRADLYAAYGGTRLGLQELEGLIVEDVGTTFQRGWFGYRDGWPEATGQTTIRYWDLAATEDNGANDPDWTAGVRVTVQPNGGTPLVLDDGTVIKTHQWNIDDVIRVRKTPAHVAALVLETAKSDGERVEQWIEKDPAQAGVDQIARYQELLKGIAVCHGNSPTGSKLVRSTVISVPAQQGCVTMTRASWNRSLLDELETFDGDRNNGSHDDQVDALSGAFTVLGRIATRRNALRIVAPIGGTKISEYRETA